MVFHIANTLGVADQFKFSPETLEAMVGPSNGVCSPKMSSGVTEEDIDESGGQGVVDDNSNRAWEIVSHVTSMVKKEKKKKGKRMWGRLFSTCDFTSYEKYVNHFWCQVFVLLVCGVVWCLKPPFLGTAKAATLGLLWFQHRRAKACHPARLFVFSFSFSPKLYGYNCN